MAIRLVSIAALCGLVSALMVTNPEPAEARSANSSIRAKCYKQVGAYYNPGRRRWKFYGGRNSAQRQNFHNCIDSYKRS
jgi:hypothetical protein